MNPKHATLILTWDGHRLLCEAPGRNGARAKVEVSFAELPPNAQASLCDQIDAIRAAQTEALRQQQLNNMQYVAQTHGKQLGERVYGKLAFSHALNRFRLASDNPNRKQPQLPQVNEADVRSIEI